MISIVRQLCTFHLGPLLFGIDVHRVQEVLQWQSVTRVPLAPPSIRGLINLRGQIVPVIDLRERLGMSTPDSSLVTPLNIVLRTPDGPVSLLVDAIDDVVLIQASLIQPPPETMTGAVGELITGMVMQKQRLLLLLDTIRTLEVAPGLQELSRAS